MLLLAGLNVACQSTESTETVGGTVQTIWARFPGEELRQIGETRFDDKGRKVAYRYGTTNLLYRYDERDSLESVQSIAASGDTAISHQHFYGPTGKRVRDEHYANDGSIIDKLEYSYNEAGQVTRIAIENKYAGSSSIGFEYSGDRIVQKKLVRNENSTWISYDYDGVGNRIRATFRQDSAGLPTYWEEFEYDAEGRMTQKTELTESGKGYDHIRKWSYDKAGHLVKSSCEPEDGPGCTGRTEWSYDGEGRLVSMKEYSGNKLVSETIYKWD